MGIVFQVVEGHLWRVSRRCPIGRVDGVRLWAGWQAQSCQTEGPHWVVPKLWVTPSFLDDGPKYWLQVDASRCVVRSPPMSRQLEEHAQPIVAQPGLPLLVCIVTASAARLEPSH